ncbi:hypothetical protein AYO47_03870 [Planctomyces sp. SCGC AG-212-M04]|nr:hypothetical protein AYO47_03870 [Planctomyces sp. SCGC AG-212-M04]
MVYYDGSADEVKPASAFTWDTDGLTDTQAAFAAAFYGIAMEDSDSGETARILVDISPESVYEFDVPSATYNLDTTLGPDKASGNALLDQTLETATAVNSIARSRENKTSATRLKVSFAPAHSTRSSNVNANLG